MVKRYAFRFLPVSVVLALLVTALMPTVMLAADRSIRVLPGGIAVGTELRVSGTGYASDYPSVAVDRGFVFVTVYLSSEEAAVGDIIGESVKHYEVVDAAERVDEFGGWKTAFVVPDALSGGETDQKVELGIHYVYVTYLGDDRIVAARAFEVTAKRSDKHGDIRWAGYPPSLWWYLYSDAGPRGEYWCFYDDTRCCSFPWQEQVRPCCGNTCCGGTPDDPPCEWSYRWCPQPRPWPPFLFPFPPSPC